MPNFKGRDKDSREKSENLNFKREENGRTQKYGWEVIVLVLL